MLIEPKCWKRHCKYYIGVDQPDGTEVSERNVCEAFPERIPYEIAYGDDPHDKPFKGQKNNIVYEKGPFPWERGEENKTVDDFLI